MINPGYAQRRTIIVNQPPAARAGQNQAFSSENFPRENGVRVVRPSRNEAGLNGPKIILVNPDGSSESLILDPSTADGDPRVITLGEE